MDKVFLEKIPYFGSGVGFMGMIYGIGQGSIDTTIVAGIAFIAFIILAEWGKDNE